jgi:putative hydrolase of the HAD superfamily
MQIKTIFFDMGGTIDTYWFTPEMRQAATPDLLGYAESLGAHIPFSSGQLYELITSGLVRYHQWRLKSLEEIPTKLIWSNYIFVDYPQIHAQIEPIADDLMAWIETHYYQRRMRPEIPAVLIAIQQMGYKIGLISNVASRGQVPLNLSQYGIKHYFNPIVLSSEYGRRKPDPAIFHYAARLSNSPTSECIYIGDRISRDVLGAKRAGFKLAIQIKHDFKHGESDEGAIPDLVVNDMNELLDLLKEEYQSQTRQKSERPQTKRIQAVLFDADGVLYYRKNKDQEMNAFIKKFGSPCDDDVQPVIDELRHQAFIGELSFDQYKTKVLNLYGITDPKLVKRGIEHAIAEKDKIHFFAGALKTLDALKNRPLYLGIITDTAQPLYVKISKLERGGIGHLWDSITPSCEVGVQKPDPRIYQMALDQLGVEAHQSVFVGHKTSELQGARDAGMTTIAFNYDEDAKADFYIDRFEELADLAVLN